MYEILTTHILLYGLGVLHKLHGSGGANQNENSRSKWDEFYPMYGHETGERNRYFRQYNQYDFNRTIPLAICQAKKTWSSCEMVQLGFSLFFWRYSSISPPSTYSKIRQFGWNWKWICELCSTKLAKFAPSMLKQWGNSFMPDIFPTFLIFLIS